MHKKPDSSSSRDFKIPSQQTFSLPALIPCANVEGKPHVSISFSDALDPQQDRKAVQLGSGEVTTQIVGSRLLVYLLANSKQANIN